MDRRNPMPLKCADCEIESPLWWDEYCCDWLCATHEAEHMLAHELPGVRPANHLKRDVYGA